MLPTKNGQTQASPGTIESSRRRLGAIFSNLSLFSSPTKPTAPSRLLYEDDSAEDIDGDGSLKVAASGSVSLSDLEGSITNVELGEGRHSHLLNLPDELITHIFSFLPADHTALLTIRLVNHRLKSITESPQLWSSLITSSPGVELDWDALRQRETSKVPPGVWHDDGHWIPKPNVPKADTNRIHYPTLYRSRRLLDRVARGPPTTAGLHFSIIEHTDSVYCLAIAEPWLVTGGRDRSLQIRQMSTYDTRLVADVKAAHEGSVLACVVELDKKGGIIVTGSSDTTAAVWRVSRKSAHDIDSDAEEPRAGTGLQVVREQTLRGHTDTVLDVALASQHIVTCSKDTTIRIYSRDDYTLQHHITNAHTGPVNCLSLSPDETQFVSASGDGSWIMFSLSGAEELFKVANLGSDGSSTGHGLACIAWKGPYIVTGSNDRDVRIYDTTGTLLRRLEGHTGTVRAVDLDVDKQGQGVVVSGSYDNTVTMWNVETGRIRQRFPNAHESIVLDVQLKNGRLISASHDRTVRVMTFGADLPYRELLV